MNDHHRRTRREEEEEEEDDRFDTNLIMNNDINNNDEDHYGNDNNNDNFDDELICRICRENGTRENLVHPCKCSGSIRYVHEKCLLEWIEHSKTETCELCKHKFQFAKVYQNDTPQKLNMREFLIGSLQLGKGTLQKMLRFVIVLLVWSFITPVLTTWVLRMFFSTTMIEFWSVHERFIDEIALFQDCLIGAFLSISILVLTIFIAGVKDFVNDILRNLNDHLQQQRLQQQQQQEEQEQDELVMHQLDEMDEDNEQQDNNNDNDILEIPTLIPLHENVQEQNEEELVDYSSEDSDDVIERLMQPVIEHQQPLHQPDDHQHVNADQQNNNDHNNENEELLGDNARPIQIVFQDENEDEAVDLEEFIGLKGSYRALLQNCLIIVLMNTLYLFALVFVPFTFGRFALSMRTQFLLKTNEEFEGVDIFSKLSVTAVGYLCILIIGFVLFVILLILQRLLYSNSSISASAIGNKTLQVWLYIQTILKVTFVSTFNFGISPVCCGTVLNLATADFFGSTMSARISTMMNDKISFLLIHWFLGLCFLFNLSSAIRLLRRILRKKVLWFLNDPDDPNFSFIREAVNVRFFTAVRRIAVTLSMFVFLILALVRAPLKLCKSISGDTFPLALKFSHPFLQIGVDIVMYSILTQIGFENIRPQLQVKTFAEQWIKTVSTALDLNDYLFPHPVDENAQIALEEEEEDTIYKPPMFALRMALLLMLAWSTCTLSIGGFILIPLLVGRGVLWMSPHFISSYFFRTNDLYTHLIGSYLMGASMIAITFLIQQVQQRQVMNVLTTVANYITLGIKCFILGALWFTVIPVLLGLAFEISIVIPVLMSDKTALMPLSELWAFGVFLSGICVRFTYLLKNVQALDSWRLEFDRVAANGAQQLEATRVFMNIIFPIIFWLSVFISVPYLFAKLLAPFIVSTRLVQHRVQIYSYPIIVLMFLCYFLLLLIKMCWNKLHENIRDRRYLIRRSVVNLENLRAEQEMIR